MSTLQQIRNDVAAAWDNLLHDWQRLYHHAAGAITRFTKGHDDTDEPATRQELASRSAGWGVLAAEVFDGDDRIVVRLETPGMERDDFSLEVRGDHLVIQGEKRLSREENRGRWHITECAYGRFERAIPLPDAVDADKASASYQRGILRVELPKLEGRRRRTIKVNVG
jgi:HSP20 family protein